MFQDLEKLKELAEKVPAQLDRLERKLDGLSRLVLLFTEQAIDEAADDDEQMPAYVSAVNEIKSALAPAEQGGA